MANGYMPRTDAGALQWMNAFVMGIAQQPAAFKVSLPELEELTGAVHAFAEALSLATGNSTRTSVTVLVKDETRRLAERVCRPIYARIKADVTIENGEKISIGVRPINPERTRISVPQETPVLSVIESSGTFQALRFSSTSGIGSAKPKGASALQLFRHLAEPERAGWSNEVVRVNQAEYLGTFTRNPIRISYLAEDDLKVATYFARWISRTGNVGPWSRALSVRVVSLTPLFRAAESLAA